MATWTAAAALLLLLGLSFGCASASDGQVVQLTEEEYSTQVLGTPSVWLVEFVQKDCQSCQAFAPEYALVASALKGIAKVGVVSCNDHPKICAQEKVQRIPALKGFSWEVKRNPYTDKLYKDEEESYQGPMRHKDVVKFAHSLLPSQFVHNITAGDSYDKFLKGSPELPKVVLLSAKQSVPPMYKALSLRFRDTMSFGQGSSSDDALVELLGAKTFPAVLVLPAGKESPPSLYEGTVAPEDIAAFLRQFAPEASAESAAASASASSGGKKKGAKEGAKEGEEEEAGSGKGFGWVRTLDAAQFKKDVILNEEIYLAAFLDYSAAENCGAKIAVWHKEAQNLQGLVFCGEVNHTTAEQKANLAAVYKFPVKLDSSACINFLLFPFGDEKEDSDPVVLPESADHKAIQDAVYRVAPSTFVQELSEANFQQFAYADMAKPKFILVSSKSEVPPMWRVVSTNFRENNLFGFVSESQKTIVEQFRVTKFPKVLAMVPQPDPKDKTQMQLGVMPYQGPMKFAGILTFVVQVTGSVRNALGYTLEVPEVKNDEQFKEHCTDPGRLCVVGLFKTDAVLEEFKRVAGKWEGGGQFSFLWVDASSSSPAGGVPAQLEVPLGQLPTALVLSPGRMRMAALPDAFSFESLNAFLDGLLVGKVRTFEMKALPNFEASAKMTPEERAAGAGTGSDSASGSSPENMDGSSAADEPPVEEEFDLADIMSEHVEEEQSLTKEQLLQEVDRELEEQERMKAESSKKSKKKKKKNKKKKKAAKEEL